MQDSAHGSTRLRLGRSRTPTCCRRGFTLVELLIVTAIVAILASVAYPSYQEHITRTRRAEAQALLMQLMQQQERFFSQRNTYIAFNNASTDSNAQAFRWFSGETPQTSAYQISGAACPGNVINGCIQLRAVPGGPNVNTGFADPRCGTLTLSSNGERGVTGTGTVARCW